MIETILPNSRETEAHEEILGIFLINPNLFKDFKSLDAKCFQESAWLFNLMRKVDNEEGLTFKGLSSRLELQQIKLLHELRKTYITENRLPQLISHIKGKQLQIQIENLAKEILESDGDPNETLRLLQKRAFDLYTTDTDRLQNPGKDVDEWADYMMEIQADPSKAFGIMTGFYDIDNITTGWHRTDFSVIGARTSIGKTAFMLDTVLRLNRSGYKCAIFSLEMTKRRMYNRMMANMLMKPLEAFRTGQLQKSSYDQMQMQKNELKTIYVDDTRGIGADYIADVMRRLKRTQGLDFVAVDYIQDVKEQGETNDNNGSAIARVCRKLRTAAQECDCHVMGLSQVVRAVEDRKDKRPGNADLSGSTGIETAADVIGMLYRDEVYDPKTSNPNVMEINFTKQRDGRLGRVEVFYDKELQRITPLYGKH